MAPPAAAGVVAAIKVPTGVGLILVVVTIGVQFLSCDGPCASVACTSDAPCSVQTAAGTPVECTSGTACTAASLNTICESRWYWVNDCTCKTVRTGTNCEAKCIK